MNAITELYQAMAVGIKEDTDLYTTDDLGDPRAGAFVIIGPPQMDIEGYCTSGFAELRIKFFVLGTPGVKVTEHLLNNALPVAACLERRFNAAVRSLNPIDYAAGGHGDRPAYELNVEIGVSLDIS